MITITSGIFLLKYVNDPVLADQKQQDDYDYYKLILDEEPSEKKEKEVKVIETPLIQQLPELPRGCEVTSLAMLLNSAGISVNKLTLADEIKKDPTPYHKINGQVHFGNPYEGFVGSMSNSNKPGYGVYHGPIYQLAKHYLPKAIDITGSSFNNIEEQLKDGHAVWVIVSINYKKVNQTQWLTWYTPSGQVRITKKEHSVLLTGYDDQYVYVNDPLGTKPNKKVLKEDFIEAWEQFGAQAVSYK